MCGIAGILGLGGRPVELDELRAMSGMLVHRGPDDDGYFLDASVGLTMRRLSIIDLESGRLIDERASAFVAAYDAVRPLQTTELRLMPALMRAAALRFWTSRLWDLHLPRDAAVLTAHDPTHFERVLVQRRDAPWHHNR